MKIYTLVIAYNDDKEEIEYISEEIEGDSESVLQEYGIVKMEDYFDEDELEFVKGCYIIGEA